MGVSGQGIALRLLERETFATFSIRKWNFIIQVDSGYKITMFYGLSKFEVNQCLKQEKHLFFITVESELSFEVKHFSIRLTCEKKEKI